MKLIIKQIDVVDETDRVAEQKRKKEEWVARSEERHATQQLESARTALRDAQERLEKLEQASGKSREKNR